MMNSLAKSLLRLIRCSINRFRCLGVGIALATSFLFIHTQASANIDTSNRVDWSSISEAKNCKDLNQAIREYDLACSKVKVEKVEGGTNPIVTYDSEKCRDNAKRAIDSKKEELKCESDGDNCEKTKEDFRETMNACKAIPTLEVESGQSDGEILNNCAELYENCRSQIREKESADNEPSCAWFSLGGLTSEQKEKVRESATERESELLKQVAQSEVDSQKMQDARRKRQEEIQRTLQEIQMKLAMIPSEINQLEQEVAFEKLGLDKDYSQDLLALKTQLEKAQGLGIFNVESQYDDAINSAKNLCRAKATKRYGEIVARIQAQMGTLSGVPRNFQKQPKAKVISEKMAKCINDDIEYTQALNSAAKSRVAALEAKKTEINNLREKINQLSISTARQSQILMKQKDVKLRGLGQKQQALAQEMNTLQAELTKLGSPDQSEAMSMMQQQSQFMREFQTLSSMKEQAQLSKIAIDKDNFSFITSLEYISDYDEDSAYSLVEEYNRCRPARSSSKSSSDAVN